MNLQVLLLFLIPTILVAEDNPWPKQFKVRPVNVSVVDEPASGSQVTRTKHYRIVSETIVNRPDLERFATVVESVPQLLELFPLPLWAPPDREQLEIVLCKDGESFQKRGGHKGAVGWYDGRQRHILILADYFLEPPTVRPTRLQPRPNQDLLVHELVHQCMHGILWRTPPWFSEGVAEYFAVCHQGNGWYRFDNLESAIRDHLRRSLTTEENGTFKLLPVGTILDLDSASWLKATQDGFRDNPYLPYATALLLAHYHLHGGAERRDRTKTHLERLHALTPRDPTPPFPVPEKAAAIEARLIKFWRPRGLNLVFGDG